MKKVLIIFSLVFCLMLGLFIQPINIFAEGINYKDSINYLAFGDSISAGYGLEGYDEENQTNLPVDSYNAKIIEDLKEKYTNINSSSYAKSGDDSQDLINLLEDPLVQEKIASADIITVSIGANDILGLFSDTVAMNLVSGTPTDETPFEEACDNFYNTQFPTILNKFKQLNSNAHIIFSSIYNPYEQVAALSDNFNCTITLMGYPIESLTKTELMPLKDLTDKFVCNQNSGDDIFTINETIKTKVSEYDNFYYCDIFKTFDEYTASSSEDLVNVNLSELDGAAIDVSFDFLNRIDPHPTKLGHEQIFESYKTLIEENLVVIKFNYNFSVEGRTYNYIVMQKNTKIVNVINLPSRSEFTFAGWYKDASLKQIWDFNFNANEDLNLYAKWSLITNNKQQGFPFYYVLIIIATIILLVFAVVISIIKTKQKNYREKVLNKIKRINLK